MGIPPDKNTAALLYMFSGKVQANNNLSLNTGDSLLLENENLIVTASETSDLVLFMTKTDSTHFDDGMYSGNQI